MMSNAENKEFAGFLLSDLGRQVLTSNKLSIHVDTGDIFYENHNTGENFYNFLIAQHNEKAAFIPKKFSNKKSFKDNFSRLFLLTMLKNMICSSIKMQNISFINLMTTLKFPVAIGQKLYILVNRKILLVCRK